MTHPPHPATPRRRAALRSAPLLLLAFLLVGCGDGREGASGEEGEGWGVVVGVSRYEHFPPLEGGAEQARRMLEVFQRTWGIPRDHIRLLLDTAATRRAIRSALMEWLPSVVAPGDEVVVFLAGYGSRIEDVSGDEEDGMDEGFCPVDALPDSPRLDILDDALALWLDRLPTDRVTLIVDSDHPGQGDMGAPGDTLEPGAGETLRAALVLSRCGSRQEAVGR